MDRDVFCLRDLSHGVLECDVCIRAVDGFVARVGDHPVKVCHAGPDKILRCAHLQIRQLEICRVGVRLVAADWRASREESDNPHHDHDRCDPDHDRKPVRLFFLRCEWWSGQAAHVGIVDCRFSIANCQLSIENRHLDYSPPTMSPSMRMVGAATAPRKTRSLPISEMFMKTSFRLPATVISSTGYASSPPEIQSPEAPRE